MFSLLIIICLLQLWLVLLMSNGFTNLRLCFIKAAILVFALIAFNTEILSLFNGINARNVTCFWLTENLSLSGMLLFQKRDNKTNFWHLLRKKVIVQIKERISPYKAYIIVLTAIYGAIFFVAVSSVPNTADSMTYHMARVANWIQSGNVNFYPTATLRQLYLGPLAEYGILNILLLSGNDHFVNLLQFGCFIGCGVTVSLIVREFNQNGTAQILAMLLTVTIPMAILQASSTQNDLVVSFFALNFFLFYLRTSQSENRSDLIFGGLVLGLGFLTKGTAYIYCAPIAIIIFVSVIFSRSRQKSKMNFFVQSLLILFVAVSINFIQYTRNYQLFGSPIATGDDSLGNQNLTPKMIAANVVRNYVNHLGTPFETSTNWVADGTANLLGNELNNPDSSFLETLFKIQYSNHEDDAGNFVHILLLTICMLFVLNYDGENRKKVFIAAFTIIFGFALFSSLLKWNPWLSRLHTPFFMLGCIIIAIILDRLNKNIRNSILIFCLFSSVSTILLGEPRSIFAIIDSFSNKTPRIEQYFANKREITDVYLEAVTVVKTNNPQEVGLMMENDYRKYNFGDWEYPVWILLKKDFSDEPLIKHVGLKNISRNLITNTQMPEWVISESKENLISGIQYDEVWSKEPLHILKKRASENVNQDVR